MPILAGLTASSALKTVGIKGMISIGLAIALAVVMWRADVLSNKLETKRDELASERASHQVTRNSVDILETELGKFIGAGQAARVAQLAAIEAQAKKSADLRAEANSIRSMIDGIDTTDECRTPDFVMGD